jgi:F-type H+-transporting ATPase subunit delta
MADNDFINESVGHVYAQAVVNLAIQQNVLAEVTQDVQSLRELFQTNQPFAQFLNAVTIADDQKIASLKKMFEGRLHPLTLQTLNSMARRERLIFMPGFLMAFDAILEKLAGRIDVQLVSAQPMDAAAIERIRAAVARSLSQEPVLKVSVDPKLVGGIRLRVGDTLFDGSVETQLENLERQMRQHGAARLHERFASVVSA